MYQTESIVFLFGISFNLSIIFACLTILYPINKYLYLYKLFPFSYASIYWNYILWCVLTWCYPQLLICIYGCFMAMFHVHCTSATTPPAVVGRRPRSRKLSSSSVLLKHGFSWFTCTFLVLFPRPVLVGVFQYTHCISRLTDYFRCPFLHDLL